LLLCHCRLLVGILKIPFRAVKKKFFRLF
jgi:hypothetical protein